MKYKVKIDGNVVEEDQVLATGWEDKYYFRYRLKGIYDVNSGGKIEFICWINPKPRRYIHIDIIIITWIKFNALLNRN